jgi:hypothetical protein
MRIRDWEITPQAGTNEVSAEVDGFRLWYRVPDSYPFARSADPFLAAALLPAMVRGEQLEVDPTLTVSPKLLKNIFRLQEIFHTWNPALNMVEVTARSAAAQSLSGGALSFYSGGADSTYTFLKQKDEITHLVFIHGFDFFDAQESYRAAVQRNTRFAETHGKTLIPVETNYYPFGYRYRMNRNLSQGGCLASVALLLGFATAYVPASQAYDELTPFGSHPLTDPLWSNEATEVVHDGCEARRSDKLRAIVDSGVPLAMANLRVCFKDINVNCGQCAKCLRTMVTLRLLGADDTPFPPLPPLETVIRVAMEDNIERAAVKENLTLALTNRDPRNAALRIALSRAQRRIELRRGLRSLDAALLGGRLRRLAVRRQPAVSIESTPPDY